MFISFIRKELWKRIKRWRRNESCAVRCYCSFSTIIKKIYTFTCLNGKNNAQWLFGIIANISNVYKISLLHFPVWNFIASCVLLRLQSMKLFLRAFFTRREINCGLLVSIVIFLYLSSVFLCCFFVQK